MASGFTVSEAVGRPGAVTIDFRAGSHSWTPYDRTLHVVLDNLDEAQALRDALSAFLEFHRRENVRAAYDASRDAQAR